MAEPVVAQQGSAPNTLSAAEQKDGFELLFDGKTTEGWKNYKKTEVGPGWKVVDGILSRAGAGAKSAVRPTRMEYG